MEFFLFFVLQCNVFRLFFRFESDGFRFAFASKSAPETSDVFVLEESGFFLEDERELWEEDFRFLETPGYSSLSSPGENVPSVNRFSLIRAVTAR